MRNNLAPICLFTYNRLEETKQTVEALQSNLLANESELFVFSDGSKNERDAIKVDTVRDYLNIITGFNRVTINEAKENKGLANSIIAGVTEIIEKYGKVIVLEDDLITSRNFLEYMNQALDYYEYNMNIFSISGFTMNLPSLDNTDKDYYLGYRNSSWGWGTWKDRWEKIDWSASGWQKTLYNPIFHYKFMRGGSDMPYMLWKQMQGKIDSWAIRLGFDQFKKDKLTVYPTKSKVINIGFGESATHTKKTKSFQHIS
ncbi:glycosyltransferase [Anaerophaga thermohalophila]|uniref:glycosyltransferase n=1 Tax=Anaerophaga thermohalophila TaxID=177400 RepID=UPI000237CE01|nr:glycosyltransferase [Anaerophaga thermohalophila]